MHPEEIKTQVLSLFDERPNPWADQVKNIMEDFCRTSKDSEVSVSRAKEFALSALLEEKQARKTGSGVFAGTVHSVKGMEFSHVFILDHGWPRQNIEEERRLFYVGMTRAMKHLTLFNLQGSGNPHAAILTGHPCTRTIKAPAAQLKGFSPDITITTLGLEDLFISYPKRFAPDHPIHEHLAALKPKDLVTLKPNGRHFGDRYPNGPQIDIVNAENHLVGRLSQKGREKWTPLLSGIVSARISGVVVRDADQTDPPVNITPCVTQWHLPIVEVLHRSAARIE